MSPAQAIKNLKQKQSELPKGCAIVEFLAGEAQLYIFIVTPERLSVKLVNLSRKSLTADVLALRRMLSGDAASVRASRPVAGTQSVSPQAVRAHCHALYEKIFAPLLDDLSGVDTLVIVPNGVLHYLPFQVLVTDVGKSEFLVDRYAITYLCEESFMRPTPTARARMGRLLLLGNPDGTLSFAEAEVKKIRDLYPDSDLHVGSSARKERVSRGGSFQGLHIASHGVLDAQDAPASYIVMAAEGNSPGRLTLREVWGLNLEGVDLVTLSACSTAVGEQSAGDELVSLENAFIFAGASSVVASLWNVADEATALLMERFYANLKKMDKAQALRHAQLDLKKSHPDPYYWAPFILVGSWR
ncbi:MAG: CHAT domain-containing protein [Armatimonadetes bacterium]|nr:CHAT domain-containing protein [Armatimonadota bacterium]